MLNLKNIFSRKNLLLFFICSLFIGICTNRVLMSTSMMGIFFTAVIGGIFHGDLIKKLKDIKLGGVFISVSSLILVSIVGGWNTSNTDLYWKTLVLGSPFLFIPLSLWVAPNFSRKELTFLIYVFCAVMFITGISICANYFIHYEEMNVAISRGKAIATPFKEHIRYSLMMTFSLVSLMYLRINKITLRYPKSEKYMQLVVATFFLLMIHILSVRSGLLSLYLCLLIYAIYFAVYKRKYVLAAVIIASVVLLPIIAYVSLPSMKQKMTYMFYDIGMLANGKGSTYSDSERLISMAAGIQLVKANLITGVGTGDLQDEMNKIYSRDYPSILPTNRKLPHNQFIWTWASNGLLGICALCGGIFYPMLYQKNYRNLLLLLFFIICISSFITEATLEIQVGIAFYVSWLTILLNYLNGNHSHEDSI